MTDPLLPSRSADRVHEQVKAMAITYRLRPGERINEVELARLLGVSRTPLREALNRLAAEGFLSATAHRGYSVPPLDPAQVMALYEYRAVLETGALRLACLRASDAALAGLAAFAERSRDAPEGDRQALRLLALDEEFHERLAALSGNAEMLRALRALNERIRFLRWIDMREGRRGETQQEHLDILARLAARDAEAACRRMQRHIARRMDQIGATIRAGFAEIHTGNAMAEAAGLPADPPFPTAHPSQEKE
ncbi:GntR family transcriptional regulator [Teichococcus cervicalis]|uniref:FCD domain protein n=1 Tax=Pseudoroseomonas cervicalis ATCC 49957 TaxID=525371 RepID=D5RJZ7_9PROT|nr:GntR family transcriptional regulator [Pseudoroseomonas cervicalis]EFH12359.1 FCD domain protein [Pseudoroseomonas cervicalis ATCC 49957]